VVVGGSAGLGNASGSVIGRFRDWSPFDKK